MGLLSARASAPRHTAEKTSQRTAQSLNAALIVAPAGLLIGAFAGALSVHKVFAQPPLSVAFFFQNSPHTLSGVVCIAFGALIKFLAAAQHILPVGLPVLDALGVRRERNYKHAAQIDASYGRCDFLIHNSEIIGAKKE